MYDQQRLSDRHQKCNTDETRTLFGEVGSRLYLVLLLFTICFSFVVFILHLINSNRIARSFVYLSNWMFILFMFTTLLNLVSSALQKRDVSKLNALVYYIGIISRTVYFYIFLVYTIGLLFSSKSSHVLGEHYEEEEEEVNKNFIYYLIDICKHFLFVALMLVLFILQPRSNGIKCQYNFWHFLYPTAFLTIYTIFFWIYYELTEHLIYNLNRATLTGLISGMPIGCWLIHQGFRITDIKIRQHLFKDAVMVVVS